MWVNPIAVRAVTESLVRGKAVIVFDEKHFEYVQETVDEVITLFRFRRVT